MTLYFKNYILQRYFTRFWPWFRLSGITSILRFYDRIDTMDTIHIANQSQIVNVLFIVSLNFRTFVLFDYRYFLYFRTRKRLISFLSVRKLRVITVRLVLLTFFKKRVIKLFDCIGLTLDRCMFYDRNDRKWFVRN